MTLIESNHQSNSDGLLWLCLPNTFYYIFSFFSQRSCWCQCLRSSKKKKTHAILKRKIITKPTPKVFFFIFFWIVWIIRKYYQLDHHHKCVLCLFIARITNNLRSTPKILSDCLTTVVVAAVVVVLFNYYILWSIFVLIDCGYLIILLILIFLLQITLNLRIEPWPKWRVQS